MRRLVGNAGAVLSAKTAQRIAEDFRTDRDLQSRLVRRPALPFELVDQLVAEIGARLEWDLVQQRRIAAAEAQQLMRAVRDTATLSIVARDRGERGLERVLHQRMLDGELDPEVVLGYLRDGEVRAFESALALLAGIDPDRARRLLYSIDRRYAAALCVRASFGTAHYATLRMALDLAEKGVESHGREVEYPADTLQFIQQQYEAMRADPGLVERLVGT